MTDAQGLSDHMLDNINTIGKVTLRTSITEKHMTLDRMGGRPDDSFSLEPNEFAALCSGARAAWKAVVDVNYGRKSSEQGSVKFRRSLYFVKNMKVGEEITKAAVRSVRPGYGLAPKHLGQVIGLPMFLKIRL